MLQKELLRKIRRIEIVTNRAADESLAGRYHSVFKGRGMEFAEVRPYQPGDDIRFIDWNVSARMNELFVKVFHEERQLTIMLLVDVSASGRFGTRSHFKSGLAAQITGLLAFSAIKNNDRVGLLLFSNRVEQYAPPKKGRKHILRLISLIFSHQPEHAGTNITQALDYLNRVQHRRAIVFLISDFQEGGYARRLGAVAHRHDLIPVVIRDPMESRIPPAGVVCFADAETGALTWLDTSSRRGRALFEKRVAEEDLLRRQLFKQLGLDSIHLETHRDPAPPLVEFFQKRAKRLAP
ncbi:MAG: hypothetical protein GMKNLPBB_00693 [Myxococcota bacterium]|nr:hypothetical protein [Myxococcota bacterium]